MMFAKLIGGSEQSTVKGYDPDVGLLEYFMQFINMESISDALRELSYSSSAADTWRVYGFVEWL
jgi:hypothetical protein